MSNPTLEAVIGTENAEIAFAWFAEWLNGQANRELIDADESAALALTRAAHRLAHPEEA